MGRFKIQFTWPWPVLRQHFFFDSMNVNTFVFLVNRCGLVVVGGGLVELAKSSSFGSK